MTQLVVRRRTLVLATALVIGLSGAAAAGNAGAQSVSKNPAPASGVTGTDPCPKNYICTAPGTGGTSQAAPASTTSSSSSVVQALLILLGAS